MKVVKLQGGLGNQLFQYAALRGLSGTTKNIYIDISFLKDKLNSDNKMFTIRNYELGIFENKKALLLNRLQELLLINNNYLCRALRRLIWGKLYFYKYPQLPYVPVVLKNSTYLEGYFQSEKYFKYIRNELLAELTFPIGDEKLIEQQLFIQNLTSPVSVHVRRGDYLKPAVNEVHGVLPLTYYVAAIDYIQKKIASPFFIIFSDDPDWCKEQFAGLGNRFVIMQGYAGEEAWKDMYLMTLCKHHIIANSSFSWWGAWLSKQDDAINIAPQNWFNPANTGYKEHDIIPENWIIL